MVNASKIRCVVIVATPEEVGMNERNPFQHNDSQRPSYRMGTSYQSKPRFRPSDLLPWADPHIRSLVEQLQEEVRQESANNRSNRRPETVNPPAAESLVGEELFGDDFFDDDWFNV